MVHISAIHENVKHQCNFCSNTFETNSSLWYHLQYCAQKNVLLDSSSSIKPCKVDSTSQQITPFQAINTRTFTCHDCSRMFSQKERMAMHIENVDMKMKHKCDQCQRILNSSHALYHHKQRHATQDKYKCSACKLVFKQSSLWYYHQRSGCKVQLTNFCRSGDKANKIHMNKVLTDNSFPNTSVLMMTHTSRSCRICNNYFIDNDIYQKDLDEHSAENRYKCPTCGFAFRIKSDLNRHT